jgi:glutamyl endopeptidase
VLHPLLRDRRFGLLLLVALSIAVLVAFAPRAVADAQESANNNKMVGSSGKTLAAPAASEPSQEAFAGSNDLTGITGEDHSNARRLDPVLPPLGTSSVIGADGRTQKTATTTYPFRANVFLEVNFPGGSGTCTGFFIGPRTIATAGHCVYDIDGNDWATSITVYPGRNGGSAPYGSASACYLWSVGGWVNSENTEYDYGAIILPTNKALGNTVGWYGFFWTSNNASLDEDAVRIFGYPGDKAYGTQWGMKKRIKQVATRKLFHNVDTAGGQSGSAVYETRENGPYANSIHTNGVYGGSPYNRSTRITQGAFNNLKNWKDNPDCTP